jgi:TDG/mug DNA glycosylase family protein
VLDRGMPLVPTNRHRSFAPLVDGNTRLLILGSLPGAVSLRVARYYAHPQNQFWQLVGGAIDRELGQLPYEARLKALRMEGIGLWDMVAEAEREGSLDSAIRDHRPNDLAHLSQSLPALRALAFNGKAAATLGRRHFPALAERYATVALPSSSAAYTLSLAVKQRAWRVIADHLVRDGQTDAE